MSETTNQQKQPEGLTLEDEFGGSGWGHQSSSRSVAAKKVAEFYGFYGRYNELVNGDSNGL